MPAIINSDDGVVSGSSGLKTSGANDGILALQNNGTTNVTVTAAGNVGIGTSSPAVKLEVYDASSAVARVTAGTEIFEIRNTGSEARLAVVSADPMTFRTSNVEAMRIDSSGNVGIGTSSPGERLDVQSSSSPTIKVRNTANGVGNYSQIYFDVANSFSGTSASFVRSISLNAGNSSTALAFGTNADGGGAPAERMRIDSSGNVGIGTSSPSSRLHLAQNDSTTSHYFAPQIRLQNTNTTNGTGESILFTSSANVVFAAIEGVRTTDSTHTGDLVFRAGSNATPVPERARITNDGNFCFGTTSTTVNPGVSVLPTGRINIGRSNDDAVAEFYRSGTRVGQINVTTTATSYITSSDYRLKENIAPMTGALATVAALNPCTYTWKADGSAGQGFIAHELAEVCPQAVVGEKDAVDAEGNPQYQGIDTSFLVATLTAAIQELKAELDATKAEVAALKARTT